MRKSSKQSKAIIRRREEAAKRIEYAKNLLIYTDKSCEEIAEAVGYSSGVSFRISFKNATGLTPGQYREEHGVDRISKAERLLRETTLLGQEVEQRAGYGVNALSAAFKSKNGITPKAFREEHEGGRRRRPACALRVLNFADGPV